MTLNFRFTVELKVQLKKKVNEKVQPEHFEKIKGFIENVATDENALREYYKVIFVELLNGDCYGDEIRGRLELLPEPEHFLNLVRLVRPPYADFFNDLFLAGNETTEIMIHKNNLLTHFYDHFLTPEIKAVRFESVKEE